MIALAAFAMRRGCGGIAAVMPEDECE